MRSTVDSDKELIESLQKLWMGSSKDREFDSFEVINRAIHVGFMNFYEPKATCDMKINDQ